MKAVASQIPQRRGVIPRPPTAGLVDCLGDDVLLVIVERCVGGTALPSVVLGWKARIRAFCGRRADALLECIMPNAAESMQRLCKLRRRLVHAAFKTLSPSNMPNEPRTAGRGYRLLWNDGSAEWVWFVDEHLPLSLMRHRMRAHFRGLYREEDAIQGRHPVALSVHASVLKSQYQASPFAESDAHCIRLRVFNPSVRVIRWMNRSALRKHFI